MVAKPKVPVPLEHYEQVMLFHWIDDLMSARFPFLEAAFAIPNGGHRHIAVAKKLKAEGVRSGVPDVFLPYVTVDHAGLFIEMKRTKGGRESAEQIQWRLDLRSRGYQVCVCLGWRNAAAAICVYASIPDKYVPT